MYDDVGYISHQIPAVVISSSPPPPAAAVAAARKQEASTPPGVHYLYSLLSSHT